MPVATLAPPHAHPRVYAWFSALMSQDYDGLASLLAHGIPIDATHPLRNTTALLEACRQGNLEMVSWLLERGASATAISGMPLGTPLHCALRRRHWQIAQRLIDASERAATLDSCGRTALHLLAMDQLPTSQVSLGLTVAEALIDRHCPLDARDQEGITALHHCVVNDSLELAELLLKAGANVNAFIPETGVTPLVIAALEKNNAMCELLMEYGADPYHKTREGTRPATIYPPLLRIVMRVKAG